jgi:hypothetical protein
VLLWFNVFGAIGIKSYRFSVLANVACSEPDFGGKSRVSWAVFKERLNASSLGSYDIDSYFPVATE